MADCLEGDDSDPGLDSSRILLTCNLHYGDIKDGLLEHGLLSRDEHEHIQQKSRNKDKINLLLDMLLDKGPAILPELCKVLDHRTCRWLHQMAHTQNSTYTKDCKDLSDISIELRNYYMAALSRLRTVPWCNRIECEMDQLWTDQVIMLDQDHNERTISIEEIFSTPPETPSELEEVGTRDEARLILIQGPPGIGKTTLCRRLVYIWSRPDTTHEIKTFALVLLIEAQHISGTLKNALYDSLLPLDFPVSRERYYQCLANNQHSVLIIIDGFGELKDDEMEEVMELVRGKRLRHCCVIITSRPETAGKVIPFSQRDISLNGFDLDSSSLYIQRYFESADGGDYVDTLTDSLVQRPDLHHYALNPLNLSLLCLIVEKEAMEDLPRTKFELFKHAMNAILHHLCNESDSEIEYIGDSLPNKYIEAINVLEKLSFLAIKENKGRFTESELRSKSGQSFSIIRNTGLINPDCTLTRQITRDSRCYCFPHRTIREYFGARFLLKLPQEKLHRRIQALVNTHQEHTILIALEMLMTEIGTDNESNRGRVATKSSESEQKIETIFREVLTCLQAKSCNFSGIDLFARPRLRELILTLECALVLKGSSAYPDLLEMVAKKLPPELLISISPLSLDLPFGLPEIVFDLLDNDSLTKIIHFDNTCSSPSQYHHLLHSIQLIITAKGVKGLMCSSAFAPELRLSEMCSKYLEYLHIGGPVNGCTVEKVAEFLRCSKCVKEISIFFGSRQTADTVIPLVEVLDVSNSLKKLRILGLNSMQEDIILSVAKSKSLRKKICFHHNDNGTCSVS